MSCHVHFHILVRTVDLAFLLGPFGDDASGEENYAHAVQPTVIDCASAEIGLNTETLAYTWTCAPLLNRTSLKTTGMQCLSFS